MSEKMKNLLEKFNAAMEKVKEAKNEILKPLREALLEEFNAAFERNPDVLAFRWTQYTPYFNDGAPCVFQVNYDGEYLNKGELNDHDSIDQYLDDGEWEYGGDGPNVGSLPAELLEAMFGEGRIIIVRGEKDFRVEEYNHD